MICDDMRLIYLVVFIEAPGVKDPVTVVTHHLKYPDTPHNVRHHPDNGVS